jgi:NADH:ubiquinone oxidoreductase subunit K/NADH:ubiquinone oxidoreductase subunit 6 (subunit J)
MQAVAFWGLAAVAVAGGIAVFVVGSMARATFALLASFLAAGVELLLIDLHYLGALVILMMIMEMLIMVVFMVMYMMNPAGLMPMVMVHNNRGALAISAGVFVALATGILLTPWPQRRGSPPRDVTFDLGQALMGPKMLVMMVIGVAILATMIASVVLATHRGRYDRHVRFDRAEPEPDLDPARGPRRRCRVTLETFLLLAAALFAVGLYGALSQQSIVMVMMGLELMVNGVLIAGGGFWYYVAPGTADGQVLVLVAITVMALEMAMGFAVVTALFRARDVDVTDDAGDLKG